MITLLDIVVVAGILGFAYWGWLLGLEAASIAALELTACLTIAVVLHEAIAGFLHAGAESLFGEIDSQGWAVVLAFGLIAWGGFAAVRLRLHRLDDDGSDTDIDPLGDRLGGAVAGGFGGAVFIGGVLVTLSMIPFLASFKPSGDRLLLDVGKTALRAAGQFAGEWSEGRSLPLWGEPPAKSSDLTAGLTSEPWFDVDDDGAFTDADRYRDVDGNGTFTRDLYFHDADRDGLRRNGLLDKYVVGCWDSGLISNDRPRPKPVPAVRPEAGPSGQPATAKPAVPKPAEQRPAEPKPVVPKPVVPKPVVPKPGDPKPGDPKPGDPKPGDPKPGDPKPGDPKPGDPQITEPQPGDDF